MNLVLLRELTPIKDIGATVDKTTIPEQCKSINSNQDVAPFSPSPGQTTLNKIYRQK